MNTGKIRLGVGAALTSAVVAGGLLLGPGLISAQTPQPTPTAPQQQQTPGTSPTPRQTPPGAGQGQQMPQGTPGQTAPGNQQMPQGGQRQMPEGGAMPDRNGDGTHDKADCPKMEDGSGTTPAPGSSSGTSFRGRAPGNAA